jgi:hypothetical protein
LKCKTPERLVRAFDFVRIDALVYLEQTFSAFDPFLQGGAGVVLPCTRPATMPPTATGMK